MLLTDVQNLLHWYNITCKLTTWRNLWAKGKAHERRASVAYAYSRVTELVDFHNITIHSQNMVAKSKRGVFGKSILKC